MLASTSGPPPADPGERRVVTTEDAERSVGEGAGSRPGRSLRGRALASASPVGEAVPDQLLEHLFDYPRKRTALAYLLWLFLGLFGAHRIYLDRVWTGVAMLLTGGGLGLWWLVDGFLLRDMVARYNVNQRSREKLGLPPLSLDFMPSIDPSELAAPPAWAGPRGRRGHRSLLRLAGDAAVLGLAGVALGAASRSTGNIEAVVAIGGLLVAINLGPALVPYHDAFGVGELLRWSYRLRLFYHHHGPGSVLSRLLRPVVGFLFAPFRKVNRGEAKLYLRLGGVFVVLFLLEDLGTEVLAPMVARADLGGLTGGWWLEDVVLTLVLITAFAAPIGATLTARLLVRRPHLEVWSLSGLAALAIAVGFLAGA